MVDTSAKHTAAGADAEVPAAAGAEEAKGDTSVRSCIQSARHISSIRIQHISMPDLDLEGTIAHGQPEGHSRGIPDQDVETDQISIPAGITTIEKLLE